MRNTLRSLAKSVVNGLPPRLADLLKDAYFGFAEPRSITEQYKIPAGYHHRTRNKYFDDTSNQDSHQREVYEFASAYADSINAKTIIDIGCESGYKLVKYFPTVKTIGVDLEPTVAFLRKKYPQREWVESKPDLELPACDIVICADVIEHIPNPDFLMLSLQKIDAKRWFISTPDRHLVYGMEHMGPPRNRAHCREWTQEELRAYVSRWFHVIEQKITNRHQATQMIVMDRSKPNGL